MPHVLHALPCIFKRRQNNKNLCRWARKEYKEWQADTFLNTFARTKLLR